MKRFLISFAASALGFAVVLAGAGWLFINGVIGPRAVSAEMMASRFGGAPFAGDRFEGAPFIASPLEGLMFADDQNQGSGPRPQLLWSEAHLLNADGSTIVRTMTAGKVTAASSGKFTIQLADGKTTKDFTTDNATRIHKMGQPFQNQQGTPQPTAQISVNDKVMVVTPSGSSAATGVMIFDPNFQPGQRPGGPGGPWHHDGPGRPDGPKPNVVPSPATP